MALETGTLDVGALPIDHTVAPVDLRGGERAGRAALKRFLVDRLHRYAEDRNHPDRDATSGLSPYLHFGHLSAHEVFASVAAVEELDPLAPDAFGDEKRGERDGFWLVRPGAEAFLDQLVVWRELGFNCCHHRPRDYHRYDSLPAWARATLAKHARDQRPEHYSLDQLAAAETYDPIWNAAQRELVQSGRIHNYLRMLWGKKVLEWSPSPEAALETLIELNNRYALDGRDPNSYSGIFWCFGRYDRAWGPERPIFGTIRYMSSEATRRKLALDEYLERWSGPGQREVTRKGRRAPRRDS
jgi:deoxyribodipyrimidine photo-lyase